MADLDHIDGGERRRVETRVTRLEDRFTSLEVRVALTEQKQQQLQLTVDSRHDAFEGGQQEILHRLDGFIPAATLLDWKHAHDALDARVDLHDAFLNKVAGGFALIVVLSVTGIISGILAIFRMVNH